MELEEKCQEYEIERRMLRKDMRRSRFLGGGFGAIIGFIGGGVFGYSAEEYLRPDITETIRDAVHIGPAILFSYCGMTFGSALSSISPAYRSWYHQQKHRRACIEFEEKHG